MIMQPTCPVCDKEFKIDQTFVGLPIIRITGVSVSKMTGTEIIFHVPCFLRTFIKAGVEDQKKKVELVKP